ncbi:peptidylprolyl isomerase [Phormidium sp. CCY1219]|uniref:peptidylprolyl isomerase n=1 Tax=Phormidium sp. CCY1219 TaxID=2886104 RepID=UPI002D1EDE98|nr:peptidylprolyl isomerase [Phormidium sp. CCY1219]MEB3828709.1 peptidylprolyl isomerase [Phormidium sp. CCY1219]
MSDLFQLGDKVIKAEELLDLLKRYQLERDFCRGIVIDNGIAEANISCTEEERMRAVEDFAVQQKLTSPEVREAWLKSQGMTQEMMVQQVERKLLIEKFKTATWGPKVQSYFMSRKSSLDRVVYSLIRTQDGGLAQEIYFRISEGEQSFEDAARQYSKGPESRTGGLLGPVPVNQPHPLIGKLLSISQPRQLWPPRQLDVWFVIIRLEKFIPAQLDDAMRQHLINEMFENWLREQIQKLGSLQPIGLGAASQS